MDYSVEVTYGYEVFFFFQAEDGIRDLVRSRGLGDVYKRQILYQLYDTSGKKIISDKSIKCDFILNVRNLNSGGYILNINSKQGNFDIPVNIVR